MLEMIFCITKSPVSLLTPRQTEINQTFMFRNLFLVVTVLSINVENNYY